MSVELVIADSQFYFVPTILLHSRECEEPGCGAQHWCLGIAFLNFWLGVVW